MGFKSVKRAAGILRWARVYARRGVVAKCFVAKVAAFHVWRRFYWLVRQERLRCSSAHGCLLPWICHLPVHVVPVHRNALRVRFRIRKFRRQQARIACSRYVWFPESDSRDIAALRDYVLGSVCQVWSSPKLQFPMLVRLESL